MQPLNAHWLWTECRVSAKMELTSESLAFHSYFRSIFDCASACSLTHYCSAFHYDGATQACQLGSKETIMAAASSGASKIPVYYNQDYISNGTPVECSTTRKG